MATEISNHVGVNAIQQGDIDDRVLESYGKIWITRSFYAKVEFCNSYKSKTIT